MNIQQEHKREANILQGASKHEIMDIAVKHGAFLAGGAIRSVFASESISDYDLFFPSKEAFDKCIEEFGNNVTGDGKFIFNFTQTASAYSHFTSDKKHFQLICAVFGTPEQIIDNFDFTICMGVWLPNTNNFILNDLFLKHIAQRRLHFNVNAQYPICSLWRVLKYTKRGYKLPAIDAIKIALKIHSLNMQTPKDLKNQLMGIDTIFLKELTDALGGIVSPDPAKGDARYDFGEAITFIEDFVNNKESENMNGDNDE